MAYGTWSRVFGSVSVKKDSDPFKLEWVPDFAPSHSLRQVGLSLDFQV